MERKPFRHQHDFGRHHRDAAPGNFPVQSQQGAGENIARSRAAMFQNGGPRASHVRRVDLVADHLEREIGFHAGANVEGSVVKQRPAAMRALHAAQIIGDLSFQRRVDRLCPIMAHQHIFGRNGAIGLELKTPMAVALA